MCELFAISARLPTDINESMPTFAQRGGLLGPHKDGWGIAFYDGNEAWIVREASAAANSSLEQTALQHAPLSTLILSHIRLATHGEISLANTQPFSFPVMGKRIVFTHNGHVPAITQLNLQHAYQPIGTTDSEQVFSALIAHLVENSALPEAERFAAIEAYLQPIAELGPLNLLFSDGDHLFAFSNKRTQANGEISAPGLHFLQRSCIAEAGNQQLLLFASVPLTQENWQALTPNHLYVAKNGGLYWSSSR